MYKSSKNVLYFTTLYFTTLYFTTLYLKYQIYQILQLGPYQYHHTGRRPVLNDTITECTAPSLYLYHHIGALPILNHLVAYQLKRGPRH